MGFVGSDAVDIFDLESNHWNGSLTLNNSRGYVASIMNDTHLYFAGGFDYVNLPQIYSKASNNVEFLAKSSPTV